MFLILKNEPSTNVRARNSKQTASWQNPDVGSMLPDCSLSGSVGTCNLVYCDIVRSGVAAKHVALNHLTETSHCVDAQVKAFVGEVVGETEYPV